MFRKFIFFNKNSKLFFDKIKFNYFNFINFIKLNKNILMREIQYLDLILIGILRNEHLLKSYLIRKQKETEYKNFVSEMEFFQKCSDSVSILESNLETQYLEKKRELFQIIELQKSNKEPFEKELELANNLSLDQFNINLSTITNGKYKDELWYSQIELIKNCIVEIKNQDFKINAEIKDLDIDKYLNFVFSQKEISRETKENAVDVLMEENKQEKSTYGVWQDYVFNQQNFWKEITLEERKLFEELRTKSFEEMNTLFLNTIKGSPKPKAVLKKEFEAAIIDRLSKEPFQKTTSDFMEGLLTKDLNVLATVIGKLDFIKSNQLPKAKKILEIKYFKSLTLREIALKCYYEGKILNRDNAIIELKNTKHNSNDKLYSNFTKWSTKLERTSDPDSKVKLLNKIKLFERVIQSLPKSKRTAAIDDLKILESYITKY